MNLNSPDRPTLNGRPCFLSGNAIIPRLEFWPLASGLVEVTCFLPVDKWAFSMTRYHVTLKEKDLIPLLHHFTLDPESTLETLYAHDSHKPLLRERASRQSREPTIAPCLDALLELADDDDD